MNSTTEAGSKSVVTSSLSSLLSSPVRTSSLLQTDNNTAATTNANNNILEQILQSDDFTVAKYLNVALADLENKSFDDHDVQLRMAELALSLQLQTQSCHEEIGKIGIELQAILPRCATDMNRITTGLTTLQYDSKQLHRDIVTNNPSATTTTTTDAKTTKNATTGASSDHNTSNVVDRSSVSSHHPHSSHYSSMETLSTLHALQANLLRTKEILTAAASWDTTVESIAPLLAHAAGVVTTTTGNKTDAASPSGSTTSSSSLHSLQQAVQYLIQLEHGERALRGMPHPEERHETIQKIRLQVSSLLQPQLKLSLQHMNTNTKSLQQCVMLYTQLHQLELCKNEYIRTRPVLNGIHKLWFEYNPSSVGMVGDNNDQHSSSLVEWLPTWFDAILSLLAEERRQSIAIFGGSSSSSNNKQPSQLPPLHTIVPEIIIRVMAECFRPILPSFKSRLETIYSSTTSSKTKVTTTTSQGGTKTPGRKGGVASDSNNNSNVSTTTAITAQPKGTLHDISTIYESMLRFLSLVYEIVTGCWIDLIESSSSGSLMTAGSTNNTSNDQNNNKSMIIITDASALYKELKKVFIQIVAPFIPYQKNLIQLEEYYLYGKLSLLEQKMGQFVETIITSTDGWEILQTSVTDELLNISDDIIPIVEGSIARFELLSGGYHVTSLLQVMDRILANHATNLALAINKICSRLISTSKNDTSDTINFDEGQVMCALHMLKVAGKYNRSLALLQNKTRERLQLLSQRIISHLEREKQLTEEDSKVSNAITRKTSSSSSSFQLPESLSIVEVDSILTTAILHDDKADDTYANEIKNLIDNMSFAHLYPEANEAAYGLANSCQTFVFEVCFALPRYYLAGVSSLTTWTESNTQTENWMSSSSYGALPQAYITHIGEHMLALVQALEPFAIDRDALNLANEVMNPDSIQRVSYQFWYDFIVAATATVGTERLVKQLIDGKDFIEFALGAIPIDDEHDEKEDDGNVDDENNEDSTRFCNKWLDVIGLAVTGRLLERIIRIPSLSSKGCEQLNVDLGYIINVLSALGISGHPHILLGHMAEVCILDRSTMSERLNHFDRTNPSTDFLRAVEERILAMKG